MELGGNAPFIVFEDADIDAAIEGAMIAKMRNMGEACTAANRFYVHEKVHDEFAKKLTAKMAALKVGNGLDEGGRARRRRGRQGRESLDRRQVAERPRAFLSAHRARRRAGRRRHAARRNLRPRRRDPDLQIRGRGDQARERHRVRSRRVPLYQGHGPRHARLRAARVRHDRAQPRPRLRSGRALRRHEAVGHRPRGRARRADGVFGDAVHLGDARERGRRKWTC